MKRILNFFGAVDRVFALIVENMLIVILLAMTLLVALQVVLRNFFNSGIQWGDVAARHAVLWVAFLGAMLATRSRQHIAIDVLTRFIPRTPRNAVRIVLDAMACAVSVLLARASLAFVLDERAMGTELFLGVPNWTAEAIIPFGFAMIAIEYAIGIGLDIYRLAVKTPGHVAGRGAGVTALYLAAIIICAICGEPLFVVMGGLALVLFYSIGTSSQAVIIEMYRMASAPTLIAIPLFTFAGYLLAESKTPQRMINLCRALFGWMPGGLAIVVLIASAFFTAFNGASGVTIIALGGLIFPMLIKESYDEKFSLGLVTTSGSLGLLFPPSLPLILYAIVSQTSIDALFLAGILPGVVLIALLSVFSIRAGRRARVLREPFRLETIRTALREAIWVIPLPVVILAGIYGGFFTASEAAAVSVIYVLFIEIFIYKDLSARKDVPRIASSSMILVGGVLIILGCALGLTNYLVDEQVPMKILELMRQYITSKVMFLAVLNIFLLIVGCLMDIFSATIVVVPLIIPIAKEFGVNPVHLGIIFLTNLEIGYLTPPVGLNLFISSFRFKKPISELYRASFPFLCVLLAALLIITYFPDLSLWLVNLFGRH